MKLFLDTMIWLHYVQIDDLDWTRVVSGSGPPVIVVPRITAQELDHHKDRHKNSKVKARARRWLKAFGAVSGGTGQQFKNGTALELYLKYPTVDMRSLGLNPAVNDDVLLASVYEYQRNNSQEQIFLVTADTTPQLLAKELGIRCIEIDEALRLKEDADPTERELIEVRAELDRLKGARPSLTVGFESGGATESFITLQLSQPPPFAEAYAASQLAKERKRYPKRGLPSDPIERMLANPLNASDADYRRYNEEVDHYLEAFPLFLKDCYRVDCLARLGTEVRLSLKNDGTSPAEYVDVELVLPKPCAAFEEKPEPPEAPSEPRVPNDLFGGASAMQFRSLADQLNRAKEEDLSVEESTDSFIVRQKFRRIKHGHTVETDAFFLSFTDYEGAKSFQTICRVTAANLIRPIEMNLNIVIDKRSSAISQVLPSASTALPISEKKTDC